MYKLLIQSWNGYAIKQIANTNFEELCWYDHIFEYLSLCKLHNSEFNEGDYCYNQICLITWQLHLLLNYKMRSHRSKLKSKLAASCTFQEHSCILTIPRICLYYIWVNASWDRHCITALKQLQFQSPNCRVLVGEHLISKTHPSGRTCLEQ